MKTNKSSKEKGKGKIRKLHLKKETVRELSDEEAKGVKGGDTMGSNSGGGVTRNARLR